MVAWYDDTTSPRFLLCLLAALHALFKVAREQGQSRALAERAELAGARDRLEAMTLHDDSSVARAARKIVDRCLVVTPAD
mmetsp:Transcript_41840/g.98303  ORF Transcript_41840/g.98303 Transcript_41840/m.98303 type:complete len:80 (-) Transcript_41840:128-367(-)